MTAHYIAKIVQSKLDKIDVDEMSLSFKGIEKYSCGMLSNEWVNRKISYKPFEDWLRSSYILEEYIRLNFDRIEETDLVYKHSKHLCIRLNELRCQHRTNGGYQSLREFKKKNKFVL